ncbi:MAG TPA: M23 family metallopeptidase [Blastocatellia bacterium]|nr:M23 family metallopeptidase [Blastocatellia bacterium]
MAVRVVCVLLFTWALLFAQSKQTPRPKPAQSAATEQAVITEDDLTYLRGRALLIPVAGVSRQQLHNTYDDARSQGRQHNAIDIIAPKGTPVLAVDEGVVIKLFQSDKGGITLYQLDPSGRYAYYYAHLERYADNMAEGKQLKRGEVLGYVGDTGNAGKGNYHLHFEVSKLAAPRKWYGGTPINPYHLLGGK